MDFGNPGSKEERNDEGGLLRPMPKKSIEKWSVQSRGQKGQKDVFSEMG